jgi:putative two-component system response regulator
MDGDSILVVDDSEPIRTLVSDLLRRDGYACATAASAAGARRLLAEHEFALILCDVGMPGESGIELLRDVLTQHPDTAAMMVTGLDDPELTETARELGVYGYVLKPFRAGQLSIDVANALRRRRLEIENRAHRGRLEHLVAERTANLAETVLRLERSEELLRHSSEETIRRLSYAAEFRDHETAEHIERMSRYCAIIAHRRGLPEQECELLRTASPMHDVGKIGIPDRILLKPDPLTPEEWEIMRSHAEMGYRILAGSGMALLDLAASIAWTHHERMDGSGYPRGLTGEEIPLEGRIAAVADVFDAVTRDRCYQKALSLEEATEVLRDGRGRLFDSEILDGFLGALDDVLPIVGAPAGIAAAPATA